MDSQARRMRVRFVDSSDDGASHVVAVDAGSPRDDGEGSLENSARAASSAAASRRPYAGGGDEAESRDASHHQQRRGGDGWLSSAIYRGVNAAAGLFLGSGGAATHEPYGPGGGGVGDATMSPARLTPRGGGAAATIRSPRARSRSSHHSHSSSDGGDWEFGGSSDRGSSADRAPSTESVSAAERGSELEDGGEYDQVNLNLKDTVLLFIQTGSDVFMNIILATLKASNELVDGETFEIVSDSPAMVKVFLGSGRVAVSDARVQAVVQTKLDEVLAGDPYSGDVVPGDLLDYVRCLCGVPTSRINFQQMVLLRYSGFDYVELLVDYPYLLEKVDKPSFAVHIVFNVLHYIGIAASWIGVLVTLTFTAMVLWTVVYWFDQPRNRNNGYWIIIAYVGGYVVSLVATVRTEEGKIKRYEKQRWGYPSNILRIVPIFPLYEIMLSYVSLRYEISSDAKDYFIIRYDLRNSTLVQHITNGFFYALPQVIVQTFLFIGEDHNHARDISAVCYWLLLGCSCALMFMSIFANYRIAVFSHSCNGRGFAVLSSQGGSTNAFTRLLSRRVVPSEVATKLLVFFTMYFLIAEAVTLFVCLLNLYTCGGGEVVFLSIYVAVVGVSIVALVMFYVYKSFSRLMGVMGIPAGLMQIACMVYRHIDTTDQQCILFASGYSGWMIPSIACFGSMCFSIVAWLAMLLFELLRGTRITQRAVDYYLLI
ncbi:hypothetical protein NESM_000028800 [Novymonas esmeraldas]|uniref:Uncharacterized protein n=1 Tax=Novymonas esmeraldas TaxID=1808958 RepID=A0AAW0EZN7_9TRYP